MGITSKLKNHLNKLEYFVIIAESGSLKKASKKALVGQPQLTKSVKILEEVLQKNLLIRTSKGVALTKEGNELYKYAKEIINKVNEIEILIKSNNQKITGKVKVGTYDSIARYFFPEFLKYFKLSLPKIEVYLETGRSDSIYEKVKSTELDVGVVVLPSPVGKALQYNKIYTDSFGLFRSPSLPPELKNNLIYFPYEKNETKSAIKRFNFIESIKCDNLETVKNLTEQGLGVGLIPHRVAWEGVLSKKLIEFNHPKISSNQFDYHDIVLCFKEQFLTEDKKIFIDEVHRFLEYWYNY